jgi:hypothetical protein
VINRCYGIEKIKIPNCNGCSNDTLWGYDIPFY